ncbi:MAG TPA: 50S ribosomal protein L22 [Anaeromyxobacter sp.]
MADKKKTTTEKSAAPKAEAQAPGAEAKAPARKAKAARKAKPVAGPHATLHYLRIAPRKVRLVADHVRGQKVGDALALLKFTPQAAAAPLAKLLRSAVANAEQKGGHVDVDALFVKTLMVDQGPKMRRFMPRAMGRAYRVEKKTSHVYVELGVA